MKDIWSWNKSYTSIRLPNQPATIYVVAGSCHEFLFMGGKDELLGMTIDTRWTILALSYSV
jgi:hypothetical protein